MAETYADVETLRRFITDEVFNAIGLPASARLRGALRPLLAAPTRRFVQLLAEFDKVVALHGPAEAARTLIPRFADRVEIHGEENIPSQGGLLVASNHPGTIDGVLIAACLQRKDLKAIASGIPFLKSLPATARHLIYTTSDPHGRMSSARASIRHLQSGGALLVYPSGLVDPDPAVYPGAREALQTWSRSLELFLREAPETKVLVTIVRGMLSPGWAHSPLTWLRRPGWQRRKLAEFFQVIEQMLWPGRTRLRPRLQFAPPLQFLPGSQPMPAILESAERLLQADLPATY